MSKLCNSYGGGRVYFMTDDEVIKIGWSGAPKVRINALRSPSKKPLRIIGSVLGTMDNERALHHRFAPLLVKPREWFQCDPDLLAYITEALERDALAWGEIEEVRQQLAAWTDARRWGRFGSFPPLQLSLNGLADQVRALLAVVQNGVNPGQRASRKPSRHALLVDPFPPHR